MPISLRCECGHRMLVADNRVGERVRCPQCREFLAVPFKGQATPRKRTGACTRCGGRIDTEGEVCSRCAVALVKEIAKKAAKEDAKVLAKLGQAVTIIGGLIFLIVMGIEFVGTYYQLTGFGGVAASGVPEGPTLLAGWNWRFVFFVGALSYLLTMGLIPTAETRFAIGGLLVVTGLAIWAADARHVRLETTWGSGIFRSPFVVSLAALWVTIALLFVCRVPTLGKNLVGLGLNARTYEYFWLSHRTRLVDLMGLGCAIAFFGTFQYSSPQPVNVAAAIVQNVAPPPAPPAGAQQLPEPEANQPNPEPAWVIPAGSQEFRGSSGQWRIALPAQRRTRLENETHIVNVWVPMVVKDVQRTWIQEIYTDLVPFFFEFDITETTWTDEAKGWTLEELLTRDWETEQPFLGSSKDVQRTAYQLDDLQGAEWYCRDALGGHVRVITVALPDHSKTYRLTVRAMTEHLEVLRVFWETFTIIPAMPQAESPKEE
jgi:hypothetical protein